MQETNKDQEYNVWCQCGHVWQPTPRSREWWIAKQRADKGFLDAAMVTCSYCEKSSKKQIDPDAPFRVFGYDMDCHDFDIPFHSFVEAVKRFAELVKGPDVVFIKGVSNAVSNRIEFGH